MRIITGKYKGRRLTTVPDRSVRPATDRVKGSIFNVLQNRLDLRGADVLDLFAGSGSLGFEALSRGASRAVFVDENPGAIAAIEKNAEELDCMDACEIVEDDALTFLRRAGASSPFHLIFADPPYVWVGIPGLPAQVAAGQLLHRDGFLIIEHSKQTEFQEATGLLRILVKEFGNTRVSFFTPQTAVV